MQARVICPICKFSTKAEVEDPEHIVEVRVYNRQMTDVECVHCGATLRAVTSLSVVLMTPARVPEKRKRR